MDRYFRIIAYTPYCGEEFTGYCAYSDKDPDGEERMRAFADLLVTENADEHIHDHIEDLLDEEAREEYYEGCGARFEEIDVDTYEKEAFEDYEKEDWRE